MLWLAARAGCRSGDGGARRGRALRDQAGPRRDSGRSGSEGVCSMNRSKVAMLALAFGVLLAAGCIQIVQKPSEPEIEVRSPKPFTNESQGKLEPTEVKGLFKVPELDKTCYYYQPKKEWYRYSYNRWFQA